MVMVERRRHMTRPGGGVIEAAVSTTCGPASLSSSHTPRKGGCMQTHGTTRIVYDDVSAPGSAVMATRSGLLDCLAASKRRVSVRGPLEASHDDGLSPIRCTLSGPFARCAH